MKILDNQSDALLNKQLKESEYYLNNFLFNLYEFSLFYCLIYTLSFFIGSIVHEELFFVWFTGMVISIIYSSTKLFENDTPFSSFLVYASVTTILCLSVAFGLNVLDETIMIGGLLTIPIVFHAILFPSLPNKTEQRRLSQQLLVQKVVLPQLTVDQQHTYNQYQVEVNREIHFRVNRSLPSNEMTQRCKTIDRKKKLNQEFLFQHDHLPSQREILTKSLFNRKKRNLLDEKGKDSSPSSSHFPSHSYSQSTERII